MVRIVLIVNTLKIMVGVFYLIILYYLWLGVRNGRKQMAKKVSWMWGGKRYYGTLIRETKTHKFARTENGKIKKIKK